MSGAFNKAGKTVVSSSQERRVITTAPTDGWQEWTPRRVRVLEMYNEQLVVIVSKGKHPRLWIPKRVLKELGDPIALKVMTRFANVGLMPCELSEGYKVHPAGEKHGEARNTLGFIDPVAFLKAQGFRPGAYRCHIDNGIAIFDAAQTPATL